MGFGSGACGGDERRVGCQQEGGRGGDEGLVLDCAHRRGHRYPWDIDKHMSGEEGQDAG